MIKYTVKELKSILFITLLLFPFMYSCGNNSLDSKELKNLTNDTSTISYSSDATADTSNTTNTTGSSVNTVVCDTDIYGDDCLNLDDFILVKKEEVKPEYIRSGASIGGIKGSLSNDVGDYHECSLEGEVGCISTETYKALKISNHRHKILSSENILGIPGTFIITESDRILTGITYGVDGSMVGSLPYCDENGSDCYLRSYSEGESGYQLKAINYDDLYSKRSNIKNGYELVSGIEGTQSICNIGSSSCYIEGSSLTAVDSSKLIASNIKNGESLGLVNGACLIEYPNCSLSQHTECLAGEDYPSVPSTIRSSLLSSASINGTPGEISDCSSGGSGCYINGNTLKAVESSALISSNIKKDVSIAGVSGDYPSSSSYLSGATNTLDLTSSNFNSLIISDESFEWFDSAGNRYTGTGDSDLIPENLRNGISVFGVTGSYGEPLP